MSVLRSVVLAVVTAVALVAALLVGRIAVASALTAPHANAAAHRCGDADIAVTATGSQGAAGHSSFVLEFDNISGVRCTLRGYPGLDAIGKQGHVLAHAQRRLHGITGGASKIRTILVKPGHFASANVGWANAAADGGDCTFSHSVNATPAGTGYTVHLAKSVSICDLEVHPTVAGTSGQS
jgi:hypothetical protein